MKVECLCKLNETGREKQILHGYTCGIIKKKKVVLLIENQNGCGHGLGVRKMGRDW